MWIRTKDRSDKPPQVANYGNAWWEVWKQFPHGYIVNADDRRLWVPLQEVDETWLSDGQPPGVGNVQEAT